MGYFFEEELLMLVPGLLSGIPSSLFGIATYVLTSLAIYNISCRRGLKKAWLAWIPVVNCWLLGSISDQYQYVVKGEAKSKRKWLLVLSLIKAVLTLTVVILVAVVAAGAFFSGSDFGMRQSIAGPVIGILGVAMPLAAAHIAYLVIRYMALYDVYRSVDPGNSVLYLVLSILFSPTEPFFLFFNREKDLGMPPRKQRTVEAEYVEAEIV
jgi:hypothetical protein